MESKKVFLLLYTLCQVLGFALTSYGVLRESFADLASKTGFGEGRFGEGPYGGGLSKGEELIVKAATTIGLLPGDQTLTITDRKRNAVFAIVGVCFIAITIVWDLALKLKD